MNTKPFIAVTLIGSLFTGGTVMAAGGVRKDSDTTDLTLDQSWGQQTQVFAKIALSEESHTSTINYLLDKFDVEDPVVNDTIGVFSNP